MCLRAYLQCSGSLHYCLSRHLPSHRASESARAEASQAFPGNAHSPSTHECVLLDSQKYVIPQIFLLSLLAILLSAPADNTVSCGWDVKLLWLILFSTNALVVRLFSPSELGVRSNKSSKWGFPRLLPNRSKGNNSLGMALFQELPNHFVPSGDC